MDKAELRTNSQRGADRFVQQRRQRVLKSMSTQVRREDRATIEHAGNLLRSTAGQLASTLEMARTAAAQRDALIWTAVLAIGGNGTALAIARLVRGLLARSAVVIL